MIDLDLLRSEWERCLPHIQAALEISRDDQTAEDVYQMVLRGEAQFWPGEESALVTQILIQPRGRVECMLFLAGGTLEEIAAMLLDVERFARANHADVITGVGRRGWERSFLVTQAGYVPTATVYTKELEYVKDHDHH